MPMNFYMKSLMILLNLEFSVMISLISLFALPDQQRIIFLDHPGLTYWSEP